MMRRSRIFVVLLMLLLVLLFGSSRHISCRVLPCCLLFIVVLLLIVRRSGGANRDADGSTHHIICAYPPLVLPKSFCIHSATNPNGSSKTSTTVSTLQLRLPMKDYCFNDGLLGVMYSEYYIENTVGRPISHTS